MEELECKWTGLDEVRGRWRKEETKKGRRRRQKRKRGGHTMTSCCRQDNGPISEPPTETELMARACHYHRPEICYEFDMQKPSIPL